MGEGGSCPERSDPPQGRASPVPGLDSPPQRVPKRPGVLHLLRLLITSKLQNAAWHAGEKTRKRD